MILKLMSRTLLCISCHTKHAGEVMNLCVCLQLCVWSVSILIRIYKYLDGMVDREPR